MPPEGQTAHARGLFSTQRTDLWWLQPIAVLATLGAFVIYATWRVFENAHFAASNGGAHYLSPFGTPNLTPYIPEAWVAAIPLLAFPAILVLPIPAGFRFTCYYFRRAYYRSFVGRPANCSVEAVPGKKYNGERGLMIVNNLHRYFLYLAIGKMLVDSWHVITSVATPHGMYLGVGVGILAVDIVLLWGYVLGCHSLRHIAGGRLDCFSCDAVSLTQHTFWSGFSRLNRKHGFWAMASLFSVALTDLYIRYLAMHPEITHFGVPV
jgi:hypothetical protein